MRLSLDHLVVTAPDLDSGSAWVAEALGVWPTGGGRHDLMGTHNRVLSLGPDCYLEVIAVDPAAGEPDRPRWFGLDTAPTAAGLTHWVLNTNDLDAAAKAIPAEPIELVEISRGDLTWRMTVPRSGGAASRFGGAVPPIMQWRGRSAAASLSDTGCRLVSLTVGHPRMGDILAACPALADVSHVDVQVSQRPVVTAEIATPSGIRHLGG